MWWRARQSDEQKRPIVSMLVCTTGALLENPKGATDRILGLSVLVRKDAQRYGIQQ